MPDVLNNATTEGVKLFDGQKVTCELVMNLKTLFHNCLVSDIDIIIAYYDADNTIKYMDIEIRNRKDFYNFIATYGNSVVNDWGITNDNGIAYLYLYLKNLVNKLKPTTKIELKEIIEETIEKQGLNCDLNFIDVSLIEDMTGLFDCSEFNGDISRWDVSNVKDMKYMFFESEFNGDISNWDVSNVKNMDFMFFSSHFNNNISKWNVSNVRKKRNMFGACPLENNPPEWY